MNRLYSQFNAALLDIFPASDIYPLAKNFFVFEENDGAANLDAGDCIPGLVVIPSVMGNKKLYLGTLLADLCSQVLGEFGMVVSSVFCTSNVYTESGIDPSTWNSPWEWIP